MEGHVEERNLKSTVEVFRTRHWGGRKKAAVQSRDGSRVEVQRT